MVQATQDVKVVLTNGPGGQALDKPVVVFIEAIKEPGEQEVAGKTVSGLKDVLTGIQAVSSAIAETMQAVRPDKFSIQLGFEFKAEAGGLVAAIVRSGGSASVQVTLEWERADEAAAPGTGS